MLNTIWIIFDILTLVWPPLKCLRSKLHIMDEIHVYSMLAAAICKQMQAY